MKKFMSFFICAIILITSVSFTANAKNYIDLDISKDKVSETVKNNIYGVSADKISNVNGTNISSNLIYNNSFEHYSITENKPVNEDYWHFSKLKHSVKSDDSMNKNNKNYEVVTVSGNGKMSNLGFVEKGSKSKKSSATIGFKDATKYDFSCYIKNIDFEGNVFVYLDSSSNKNVLTEIDIANCKAGWKKVSATLESTETESGAFTIEFEGNGTLQIDFVSLIPQDSYSYDKDEWKFAHVRYDLVKAISKLNPSYIRFPLIIDENMSIKDYNWKDTVGPVEERKYTENNTSETGFGEYLNLCDDLNVEAIPSFNANVSELNETELKDYIQNICDFIEYANGGSIKTYWGAIRAGHGHSEPYNLKTIELVGDGSNNFNKVCNELNNKYQDIKLILSTNGESKLKDSDIKTAFDYANAIFSMDNSKDLEFKNDVYPLLLNVDFTSVSLTPSYFTQMIFANNCGNKNINTSFNEDVEGMIKSVTVNENEQALYVKIVNQKGSSQTVNLNLNGFDKINYASNQNISAKRDSSKNNPGSPYYVAPKDTELNVKDNVVTVEIEKYSVNVIRIAYGGNDGASLYKLPNDTPTSQEFMPVLVKILIPCVILCVIASSAIITLAIKSSKRRKAK